MKQRMVHILALLLSCAAIPTVHAAEKTLYRWVDSNGEIHYSDQLPPSAAKQGRSVLNDQGITVKNIAPPKTAAQLAEEARQAKLREEQARIAAAKAAQDQQLLNTYQDEASILRARDSKLSAIENLIEVSHANIRALQERLNRLTGTAADLEREGKSVTPALQKQIDGTRAGIAETEQFIARKRQEQDQVRKQYQADLERYRTLNAEIAKRNQESAQ